jgi:signal peptidase I
MYIRTNSPYKKIRKTNLILVIFITYLSFSFFLSIIFSFIKPYIYRKNFFGIFFVNSSIVNFKLERGDLVNVSFSYDNNYLSVLMDNIINFLNPKNLIIRKNKNEKLYIIIAKAGDVVYYKNGYYYVNGTIYKKIRKEIFFKFDEIKIPDKSFFCISLDESDILDSSIYGPIKETQIKAKSIYKRKINF